MVYALLKEEMAAEGGVHALQLRTRTRAEEERQEAQEVGDADLEVLGGSANKLVEGGGWKSRGCGWEGMKFAWRLMTVGEREEGGCMIGWIKGHELHTALDQDIRSSYLGSSAMLDIHRHEVKRAGSTKDILDEDQVFGVLQQSRTKFVTVFTHPFLFLPSFPLCRGNGSLYLRETDILTLIIV
jgi:hypothetical protein